MSQRGWKDNIIMDLAEVGIERMNWEDRDNGGEIREYNIRQRVSDANSC